MSMIFVWREFKLVGVAGVVVADRNPGGNEVAREICERGSRASFVLVDVADKDTVKVMTNEICHGFGSLYGLAMAHGIETNETRVTSWRCWNRVEENFEY